MTATKTKPTSFRRARKVVFIILSVIIVLVLGALLAIHFFFAQGMPRYEGKLTLPALDAPVSVVYDAEGVPHITAESVHDLYIAQGYVQAQDRMFQMDLSRRQASGRLSEVFGQQAVEQDKMFRVLGLRRAAEKSLPEYSKDALDALSWYCEGVNAYLAEGRLPSEFTLAGYKPEPWTPLDCLTIAKYMAHDLGGHWESQAFRQYLLENFTEEEAYELFPSYPETAPYIIGQEMNVLPGFVTAAETEANLWNGSNNWVVSGEKSASGMPIVSNDPHLSIATPSVWIQMHLKAGDLNVSGVIFGGIPGIIVGHNQYCAWGVTNTSPDVQDLYIEKQNPDNPYEFLYMDKWEKASVFQEDILVKGGEVIPFGVVETRHGPVISDLAQSSEAGTVYSLKWTALDATREMDAVLLMNRAKNWEEFEKALEYFQVPTQNFVFADVDGTIAYKANGLIPIRKGDGLLPVPGWTDEYEWTGFIPWDELPCVVNPASGYVATANNKVISDDYPYHISHIWSQPYREMRIKEVLESQATFTVQDMEALQNDVVDLHAKEFLPLFQQALAQADLSERQAAALNILAGWDFDTGTDAAAPLIFNLWYDQISPYIFGDALPEDVRGLFEGRSQTTDALLRKAIQTGEGIWISKVGGIENVLLTTLDRALDQIESLQGKDMAKWQWGKYHRVGFVHPLSSISLLKPFFNSEGMLASSGSNVTVRAASYRNRDGLNNHGASWRFIIDLADTTKALQIVAPGQSGHVKSPYYHKQIQLWLDGGHYVTETEDVKGRTLTLVP